MPCIKDKRNSYSTDALLPLTIVPRMHQYKHKMRQYEGLNVKAKTCSQPSFLQHAFAHTDKIRQHHYDEMGPVTELAPEFGMLGFYMLLAHPNSALQQQHVHG